MEKWVDQTSERPENAVRQVLLPIPKCETKEALNCVSGCALL